MTKVADFPTPPRRPHGDTDSSVSEERLFAIKTLIKTLNREEQELLLQHLTEAVGSNQLRRGDVLGVIASILPLRRDWTVEQLKQQVIDEHRVPASPKEIYNAVGYLARTGRLQRVGYGRYIYNGMEITTSEDLGGEMGRHEDLSDSDPSDRASST